MRTQTKKWDVVVLGGLNTDFIVRSRALPCPGQTVQGDSFYSGAGGKGANQAVAAARLGAKVAMIGRVGDDARGTDAVAALKSDGVDVRHVVRDRKAPTGAAIIAVDSDGEKQIAAAPGANLKMTLQQVRDSEKVIAAARVLLMQLETPLPCVLLAARLAKKHGTLVVLDPAPPARLPARLFPLLHVIRPNSDEAKQITGQNVSNRSSARRAANELIRRGVQVVAMQSGGDGDVIIASEQELFFPRLKVRVVDATGAGDAFAAAFSVGLAQGLSLEEVGRLANATAALATAQIGAQEALPTRRQVERYLRSKR